jgi:UDP-N-acetyl-D-mannosaminuronic acid transferase (WecB/TagA/CpsF family)
VTKCHALGAVVIYSDNKNAAPFLVRRCGFSWLWSERLETKLIDRRPFGVIEDLAIDP